MSKWARPDDMGWRRSARRNPEEANMKYMLMIYGDERLMKAAEKNGGR